MGHSVAGACLEEPAVLTAFPSLLHPQDPPQQRDRILFVTAELSDFVKVGGLGDFSAALPRVLKREHSVRVLLPGYRQVLERCRDLRIIGSLPGRAAIPPCEIGLVTLDDGLEVMLVLCPLLYEREGTPYMDDQGNDWPDNHLRFARLCLAAAEIAGGRGAQGWQPGLVHANDWPSALTPAYMAWNGVRTPSLFTIHNLAYQGLCDLQCSAELGLPDEALSHESMEFHGRLSFLKAGIAHAHHITTVSETYAQEITTPEYGCGLHGILKCKVEKRQLSGIVNGIDDSWQPHCDPHLVAGFSARQWAGKRANTRYVEERFGLEPGRAAVRGGLAPGAAERHRPDPGDQRCPAPGRRPPGQHRPWRAEPGEGHARARPASSRPGRRAYRFRRDRGPPYLRRQRLPAHALALRALRAQSALCAMFRLAADRALHRRPRRYHRRRGHRLPVP